MTLPRGTVTFLFTDIEGSTRLLQQVGDRYANDVLATHRQLLRAAIGARNGHEVDTQGDALFIVFPRAKDALVAAVTAQRAIAAHTWPDGAAVRVRIALHTGEPIAAESGYTGLDVHRTARIRDAAWGGQILLSHTTRDLVSEDLPDGIVLRDLGAHRLKDLARPQRIYQVVAQDLAADFPPIRSLDTLPNNLPFPLTSFVGRQREKAEVIRLLGTTRLLTLTGEGGSGKTRLALQVTADLVDQFPDGVWVAELATLSDPALVPHAVGAALDVRAESSRPPTGVLADFLRPKSLLLVLDSCEHLIAACAELAGTLLRACPHLKILATSRAALGMAGETTWRVLSLSSPDPHDLPTPEQMAGFEAVQLFVDRAKSIVPAFALTPQNAAAVAQISHRLDGIPLALELAAARVKILSVEQIAARLDDRYRLLTDGGRNTLPRHQTLRACMDWSYNLLAEEEQTLFRRLSVFAGGCFLEAAEAVCTGDSLDAAGTLDFLSQLADKSLIMVETINGQARYRMLETVRQYSRELLEASSEAATLSLRHRDWYLNLLERAQRELDGPNQVQWLDRLEPEVDNIRAALELSLTDPDGTDAAVRLTQAGRAFWMIRGHIREARDWAERTLSKASAAPDGVRAKALWLAGWFAWRQEDHQRALMLSEESLALARRVGDDSTTFRALFSLGVGAWFSGDFGRAETLLQESLAIARGLDSPWWVALIQANLSLVAKDDGRYTEAARLIRESLTAFQRRGDFWLTAYCFRVLGMLALIKGDHGEATAHFLESLRLCRLVNDRWVTTEDLQGLALIASAQGQYERAAVLFGIVEKMRQALGIPVYTRERADYDEALTRALAALGDDPFAQARSRGQAMTVDQAIEYALTAATPSLQP